MQFDFVALSEGVDQVCGGHRLPYTVFPAAALDQVVKEQGDHVVRLDECAILVDDAEAICVTVGCYADVGFHRRSSALLRSSRR